MSEKDSRNFRRFGRQNQKDKLRKPEALFPLDEATEFDIEGLELPDTDTEALEMLSSLQTEVKAPVITPKQDRYPPIAPTSEYDENPATVSAMSTPESKSSNPFYNIMTFLLFLVTCLFIFWVSQVWINPQSNLNPFPPNTPFVVLTATPNETGLTDIVATPDESGQIFIIITDTPSPTEIATDSPFPFVADEVLYTPNTNDLGCDWWSIAGTVIDSAGNPLDSYRIRIVGDGVNEAVFSGAAQSFGAGGFELPLIGIPSQETFTVQLFSSQDVPVSDEISLMTRVDCDANVAIINFRQIR